MSNHLQAFFAQYPGFTHVPSRPATNEFRRMCRHFRWDPRGVQRNDARESFRDALVMEFNAIYGTDKDDIEAWKELCVVLEIDPIPEQLRACRKRVKAVYVNIVDLVHAHHSGGVGTIRLFGSEKELSEYTHRTGKYFPVEHAKAGGLLRYLLRQINRPRDEGVGRRRRR